MSELGIDESGRGCVLGPLVMCGVIVTPEIKPFLLKSGVRDSKLFSGRAITAFAKRRIIANIIKEVCPYHIRIKEAYEIDRSVERHQLNELEHTIVRDILHVMLSVRKFKVDQIVLDGKDLFEKYLKQLNADYSNKVIAENSADTNYVSVAAASIIAKDYRDKKIVDIFGYFPKGGGYPNPKTAELLKEIPIEQLINKYQIRQSWSWTKTLLQERQK